jgi:hypothetical protein
MDWDRVGSDGKGVRPPLKEIESSFKAKWRSSEAVSIHGSMRCFSDFLLPSLNFERALVNYLVR